MRKWIDEIERLGACENALVLLRAGDYESLADAWERWQNGSHMLWLVGRVAGGAPGSPERRKLSACSAECAELALPIWEARYPGDYRPRKAIEAAKRGDPSECRSAATAASWATDASRAAAAASWAAASDAAASWASDAASCAANAAAGAASRTAAAASWVAAASDVASCAAAAAASRAARADTLAQCADIVRRHYPTPPEAHK